MAELVELWPTAVGEQIARFAWPARIARDGTVHVHTADSVWAFELGHRAAEIAGRLGVTSVGSRRDPCRRHSGARDARRRADPEEDARAHELAAAISDEKLRESVQKAVRLSLARDRFDRPL
jgi:Protein of unknown function (DUF721).